MRKKFILLLFVLIFSIKQEEVVFSEIETVSTQAKIIESYDNTLRHGLRDMKIITPYYIDEGEVFDHRKVVLEATDENGFKIPFTEIRYKWEDKALDTSKKGNRAIALLYWEKDPFTTYRATIKVAYDLILQTQNSTIYQGEIWNPVTNFVRANDEDSNPVYWNDDRIKTNNASIDTNVPGVYYHRYTLKGQNKEVSSTFKVTVKEDQTKAELKDTELYVGQKWDLGSVFKNVVDKDENPIKPEEVECIWIDGQEKVREIDTSKPGKHIVEIAVVNAYNKWVNSNKITVTVKEEPFTIKQVPYFDFEDHILVSINKSVVNKKENPIIDLETPSIMGKDWQLQVELSPFLDKKNSKSILKGVSLYIPKGKLESDLETEEPTQYDCQLEANGKASILMHGTKTKGKGRWKNKLATKEITLSIPPENKKGNYESTLHWTLLDVPGQSVNGDLV